MKQNKITLIIQLLLIGIIALMCVHANAQISLERAVVGCAGEEVKTQVISIDYTIGEIAVQTKTVADISFTEGFQQGDFIVVTSVNDVLDELFEVDIYPNPTTDYLTIEAKDFGDFSLSLYDASGKLVIDELSEQGRAVKWSLGHLAQGVYLLQLSSIKSGQTQSYKVQKF